MRKGVFGTLLVFSCFAFALVGCANKEVVKEDEGIAPVEEAVPQEATPVAQEPVEVVETVTEEVEVDIVEPFEIIYFDLNSYVLRQDARDALANNAKWMQDNAVGAVRLEGNCDERGSDEYNLALGEKRAMAAKNYLVTLGIPADRLVTISYGKERPVDPGHNEAAWAKNRRVDFVIVK